MDIDEAIRILRNSNSIWSVAAKLCTRDITKFQFCEEFHNTIMDNPKPMINRFGKEVCDTIEKYYKDHKN